MSPLYENHENNVLLGKVWMNFLLPSRSGFKGRHLVDISLSAAQRSRRIANGKKSPADANHVSCHK